MVDRLTLVGMTNSGGRSGAGTGDDVADHDEPAVVLGVGDVPFDANHPAVRFICDDARRRRLPIRLVHGCEPLLTATALAPALPLETRVQRAADELERLSRAMSDLVHGTSVIDCEIYPGTSVAALVPASQRAALVVVHRRPIGAIRRLHSGSTTRRILAKSAAPVVVVHDRPGGAGGPVITVLCEGLDPTVLLATAVQEAQGRACPLLVVVPSELLLQETGDLPGSVVRVTEVTEDLLDRYRTEAQLLVLGRHIGGRLNDFGLDQLLRHAVASTGCPVMVVPPPTRLHMQRSGDPRPVVAWRYTPAPH